jgi:hypothetical protein
MKQMIWPLTLGLGLIALGVCIFIIEVVGLFADRLTSRMIAQYRSTLPPDAKVWKRPPGVITMAEYEHFVRVAKRGAIPRREAEIIAKGQGWDIRRPK